MYAVSDDYCDDDEGANNHLVARGERAGEKDGDMAAWAGGPV